MLLFVATLVDFLNLGFTNRSELRSNEEYLLNEKHVSYKL